MAERSSLNPEPSSSRSLGSVYFLILVHCSTHQVVKKSEGFNVLNSPDNLEWELQAPNRARVGDMVPEELLQLGSVKPIPLNRTLPLLAAGGESGGEVSVDG